MRIKLPFVEIESEKDCPCSKYEEYEVKIKCAKTKLHCKYLLVIAVLICIWLFAVLTHGDKSFVSQMSFASTITSIILSVLAIIMSITGEGKIEHIKDQLDVTAKDIKESQKTVGDIHDSIKDNLDKLYTGINTLDEKIGQVPEDTVRKLLYQNDITADPSNVDEGIEV